MRKILILPLKFQQHFFWFLKILFPLQKLSKEQIKDILPSFGIALLMAGPVFAMSFIDVSHFLLLPSQIITGAIITIITCETSKLPEYLELKSIVLSKFSHNKDSLNT